MQHMPSPTPVRHTHRKDTADMSNQRRGSDKSGKLDLGLRIAQLLLLVANLVTNLL